MTPEEIAKKLEARLASKSYIEDFLKQFPEHPEVISYASRLFDIDTIQDLCTVAEYQSNSGFDAEETFQKAISFAARIEEEYEEVHDYPSNSDTEDNDQPEEINPKRFTNRQAEAYALIAEYQVKAGIVPSETFLAIEKEAEDARDQIEITCILKRSAILD